MTVIENHPGETSVTGGQAPAGWHEDPSDPTLTRWWDGTGWTVERRWNGTEWVDVSSAPAAQATATAVTPGTGVSRTFKVLAGSAVAAVLGYFVPVTIVTSELGTQGTHTLGELGGLGVLVLAAAAATVYFALPTRRGTVTNGALWGIGSMAGIIGFFTAAVFSASGANEQDFGFDTVATQVEPSLGAFALVTAIALQVVGIAMAIGDRKKADC